MRIIVGIAATSPAAAESAFIHVTLSLQKSFGPGWCARCLLTLLCIVSMSLWGSVTASAQPAPLTSTSETWIVTLPSSQVLGVYSNFSPAGVGCMTGDFNGSGAESLMCVNRPYPESGSSTYDGPVAPCGTQCGSPSSYIPYAVNYDPPYWGDNAPPSSFLIFQSTKNPSSGFTINYVPNQSPAASQEQVKFGGLCAVADFTGDGRSGVACFGSQYEDYAANYPSYPTAWFSQGAAGATADSFYGPFANQSLTFPAPLDLTSGTSLTEVPFGPYCTTGHFMAGPGNEILCGTPVWYPTTATNNYILYRYTATYTSPNSATIKSISETQYNSEATPPTWTKGPSRATPVPPGSGPYAQYSYGLNFGGDCLTGDFNGDGLTDIACPNGNGSQGSGGYAQSWTIGYSTGAGFSNVGWTPNPLMGGGSGYEDCATGDFNGDGKTDIICAYDDGTADGKFEVYLANANGNGFQPAQTWTIAGVPKQIYPWENQDPEGSSGPGHVLNTFSSFCAVADLNGDGKSDVICYADNTSDTKQWVYGLSSGSGFSAYTIDSIVPPVAFIADPGYPTPVNNMTNFAPFASACTLGDFLGNGLVDILCNPEALTGATSSTYNFSVAILNRVN